MHSVWCLHKFFQELRTTDVCKSDFSLPLKHFQNVFKNTDKDDLLRRVWNGPKLGQTLDQVACKSKLLRKVVLDTDRQLVVEARKFFHFVKGYEDCFEEVLVFLLERDGEAVGDWAEDFKEFGEAVVGLCMLGYVD